jgi:hypothetical protein
MSDVGVLVGLFSTHGSKPRWFSERCFVVS